LLGRFAQNKTGPELSDRSKSRKTRKPLRPGVCQEGKGIIVFICERAAKILKVKQLID
jgi:hypothetical protein